MANINAPFGLAPVQYRDGTPWNGGGRMYAIAAADTNAIYIGDPVKATAACDSNGLLVVTLATAGATMRGVVVAVGTALQGGGLQGGPYINPADLTKTYRPSGAQSQVYYALVVDDPNVLFAIQEGTGTPGGSSSIGSKNANFVYGAPATGVYVSGVTLDTTTYNTTSTLNFRLMGAVQDYANTPFTANQRLLVSINNHDFSGGTTAI